MNFASSLLTDPVVDVLITGESEFDALPRVMADLAAARGHTFLNCIK
jgi:hypothetical protein